MGMSHQSLVMLSCLFILLCFVPWYLRNSSIAVWRLLVLQLCFFVLYFVGIKVLSLAMRDWQLMQPLVLELSSGRRASGGIAALLVGMPLLIRWLLPRGKRLMYVDAAALAAPLAYAVVRLTCYLNGCCTGEMCDHSYCITYPRFSGVFMEQLKAGHVEFFDTRSRPVFPLQLFVMGANLMIFLGLLCFAPRKHYAGQLFLLCLLLSEGSKAVLESFREPYLPTLQFVAAALAGLGLLGLMLITRRRCATALE